MTARMQPALGGLSSSGRTAKNKRYIDICGTIDPAELAIVQAKGYLDADAGYLANVQKTLDVNGKKLDFFMLNQDHFGKKAEILRAAYRARAGSFA
jgi:hypothetical protein